MTAEITAARQRACPTCGGAIPGAARFCRHCGSSLPESAEIAAGPESPTVEPRLAWHALLGVMLSPGSVLEGLVGQTAWAPALAISGVAFGLFFFQTGLDRVRAGSETLPGALLLGAVGLAYGTAGITLVAALAWVLSIPFGRQRSPGWVVRAFGVGYSPALVYSALGLPFNLLLGWNTAVAFGVTGVLWALGPIVSVLRSMTGGRLGVSVVLATVCGGILLFGWAFIGGAR